MATKKTTSKERGAKAKNKIKKLDSIKKRNANLLKRLADESEGFTLTEEDNEWLNAPLGEYTDTSGLESRLSVALDVLFDGGYLTVKEENILFDTHEAPWTSRHPEDIRRKAKEIILNQLMK